MTARPRRRLSAYRWAFGPFRDALQSLPETHRIAAQVAGGTGTVVCMVLLDESGVAPAWAGFPSVLFFVMAAACGMAARRGARAR